MGIIRMVSVLLKILIIKDARLIWEEASLT